MADYRFSANVIGRGKGQSAVAAAAYRSGSRLVDERTGNVCDYTHKRGIVHSEILTPENTPDWMTDRAQLWNAVEAVEKRKDAQLSREIQLSLPHELTAQQRLELVRDFTADQFVSRGMIADVAIHAPDPKGDERNHHAHIMLTMRNLTDDGFGKKAREWNGNDRLNEWREAWAHHQNRELERHGHQTRVDHRSYEAQGIDREPTHHLGPVANDMEKNGKPSRIGDENREITNENKLRAHYYAAEFELEKEIARRKSKFERWKEYRLAVRENEEHLRGLDFSRRQDRQREIVENDLEVRYATAKSTIKQELKFIEDRLSARGVRKALRSFFGQTRADTHARTELNATLKGIQEREDEARRFLEKKLAKEQRAHADRAEYRRSRSDRAINRYANRLEAKKWLAEDRSIIDTPDFARTAKQTGKTLDSTRSIEPTFTPKAEGKSEPQPTMAHKPVQFQPMPAPSPFGTSNARRRKSPQKPAQAANDPAANHTTPKSEKATTRQPEPPVRAPDELSLDDQKRTLDSDLGESRTELKSPWESSIFGSERGSGWESDLFANDRDGAERERSRDDPKPSKPE